jgi:acetyl-CoA C-acetyltransferase
MAELKQVYLASARRSPIGSLAGGLKSLSAPDIAAQVISTVVSSSGIPAESVDQVILGCVLTAGIGQAPARQAALKAGLPDSVQALTVNKVCSSGLKAVMLAADAVALGQADCVIAGGMESMSQAPYLLPAMRSGARLGNTEAVDSIVKDGLWDVYNDYHMGNAAELCAATYKLSRQDQDSFAAESYRRALKAIESGWFTEEITAIKVGAGKTETLFAIDEEPAKVNFEKLPSLRPVFLKDGTVTAANASSINDGAAAMIVCSEKYLKEKGLVPLARIASQGWHAQKPEWFTTAPVDAVKNALTRAGWSINQLDLLELNEAFSAVALACASDLKIDSAKVNPAGGAVALGHPIGASGARILTTLLYGLKRLKLKRGIAAICNGGGEATALAVEGI